MERPDFFGQHFCCLNGEVYELSPQSERRVHYLV